MGVVISSLYQLGAAAALHTLADKGDGSPAVSEPSERSGATVRRAALRLKLGGFAAGRGARSGAAAGGASAGRVA